MIDRTTIIEHMDVIGSDGSLVGKVDGLDGDRIKLQRTGSADGQHHHVPLDWVERVDSHVHLSRDRAAVLALAGSGTAAAATTARSAAATGPRKVLWPILAALAALLLLALLVSQCDRDDRTSATVDRDDAPEIVTPKVAGAPLSEGSLAYDLERFLGGKDGTPRTFTFDKLNFDSGRSVIRQADKGDLDDIARVFAGSTPVREPQSSATPMPRAPPSPTANSAPNAPRRWSTRLPNAESTPTGSKPVPAARPTRSPPTPPAPAASRTAAPN